MTHETPGNAATCVNTFVMAAAASGSVALPDSTFQTTWPSKPEPVPAPPDRSLSRSCAVVDSESGRLKLSL